MTKDIESNSQAEDKKAKASLDTEIKFIEQEHRFFKIVYNVIYYFSHCEKGDPIRNSAVLALIWRIFSPTGATTAGVGFAALLGVI